jgi:hypothetical protein
MAIVKHISAVMHRSRIRNLVSRYPQAVAAGMGQVALPTAALAECTCPEFCERDHDNE